MTVNATATRELDINRIVLRAAQIAGLMPAGAAQSGAQWENYATQGRDFLEIEVDALQAEGILARAVAFYDVTLVAGTASYALPDTTLSVVGDAMYAPPASSTQSLVAAMDRERYQLLADKTTEGQPTMYYAQAAGTVTLYLWPVPSEAGTLTIQRHRLLSDNDDGTRTVDLERYWVKYLMFATAHLMALSAGIDPSKSGYLRAQSDRAFAACKSRSAEPTPGQIVNDHRSGWNS